MIALFLNGQPELLGSKAEVDRRVGEILLKEPYADIEKRDPSSCGACGTKHFDEKEAIHCGCHDYY